VTSLARPERNITGFYSMADVLAGKRLEVPKDSIPKLSRVAVLRYPEARGTEPQWAESQRVAQQLGLNLHSLEIGDPEKFESAFKETIKTGARALAVTRHRVLQTTQNQKRIIALAAKYRLPTIHYREDFVKHGGLMSYGADEDEPFKRVAAMIDKILKGAKPADIPVEQSTKFEFVVNLKTAKQVRLTIPPNVLARADRVIR
jgi:putative ABC transport system substrate-binding protein